MRRLPVLSVWKRRANRASNEVSAVGDESGEAVEQAAVERILGRELGLITRLVGCSHREMGRPFEEGKVRYRSCLKCGARRQFNADTFETFGKFYVPPANIKNL